MKNAGPVPKAPIRTPAIAGPTSRAKLKLVEFKPTAFGKSSLPTSSGTKDCLTGASTAPAIPRMKANTKICHTTTKSVTTKIPKVRAALPAIELVPTRIFRLLNLSANLPAGRLKNKAGANCNPVTIPRIVPDPVSSRTSQS